ncbi:MAG: RNA-guided endonuclease InsQ/TnpB family protein [Caldisericum sp.]
MTKAERIKNTIQKTKEYRKTLKPVTFQLKLQNLSKRKKETLKRAFLEAKWFYNWLVSDLSRLNLPANKIKTVEVKIRNTFEERPLTILGSQVKQEIANRLKGNLKSLAVLKKNGHKVGCLKPKKFVNSIPLIQYGITYSLDFTRNRVRIQKLGNFRVLGLHQIPSYAEIANAVLVRKPSGYYLHITCYFPKDKYYSSNLIDRDIGIDFGVGWKLTLSNGIKIDFEIHETPRLKRLQRKLAKTKKGSRNRKKVQFLLRKEYEKLTNRRKDAQNKILAFLKIYRRVVFQDDWVKGWSALFGRQVHSSGVGGLKSRLRTSLETPTTVERFEPTSQECYACGRRHELSLSDRVIKCYCGWICDRDLNASLVILRKGLGLTPDQAVGLDRPELKPLEKEAAARILGSNPYIRVSFLQ